MAPSLLPVVLPVLLICTVYRGYLRPGLKETHPQDPAVSKPIETEAPSTPLLAAVPFDQPSAALTMSNEDVNLHKQSLIENIQKLKREETSLKVGIAMWTDVYETKIRDFVQLEREFQARKARGDRKEYELRLFSSGLAAKEVEIAREKIRLEDREKTLVRKARELVITTNRLVEIEGSLIMSAAALGRAEEEFENEKRDHHNHMAKVLSEMENKEEDLNHRSSRRIGERG